MSNQTRKSNNKSAKATVASPTAIGTTSSGPSHPPAPKTAVAKHGADQNALAGEMPINPGKRMEYGSEHTAEPAAGKTRDMPSSSSGAGTLSEQNVSDKTGEPALEPVALDGALTLKRVNDSGQGLTTNQGVAISDNQSSLKAGLRGPTLLEDFILREKVTHFDHERIPERVVHARGSGAHGFFECYKPLTKYTKAAPFVKAGQPRADASFPELMVTASAQVGR